MKYRTICVDPPWTYADAWPVGRLPAGVVHDGRRTPLPYPALTVEEIAALPIADLADDEGCHLYLWTTNRYLPSAFDIVRGWGFRYSQTLVWTKTPMGIGPGGTFAQNAEFILFARRGTLPSLRRLNSVWHNWPRTGSHSQKPEHFYDLVEQVSPGPYVELFARRHRLQWDVHGFESANTAALEAPA